MSKDLHEEGFTEQTKVKLELFSRYLRNALPVFFQQFKRFVVADLFAGPGEDRNGHDGSPAIIVSALRYHQDLLSQTNVEVVVFLNDKDGSDCAKLRAKVNVWEVELPKIKFIVQNEDAANVFPILTNVLRAPGTASLVFLDQYGVKFVTPERFKTMVETSFCDLMFFVASSYVKRFPEEFGPLFGITVEEIGSTAHEAIHRLICESYETRTQQNSNAHVTGFTINKGKSIYGLVFMTHHLLGLQKFLDACWKIDPDEGASSKGDSADDGLSLSLFGESELVPEKVLSFRRDLKDLILKTPKLTERDVVKFTIKSGMLGKHARPIIDELLKKGFIHDMSFTLKTVDSRDPKILRKVTTIG